MTGKRHSLRGDQDLKGQRVLVTGGAGFIGSHIVDLVTDAGGTPIVLDDLSTGSTRYLPPGVELLECDIADPRVIGVVVAARPDLVIHAAAQVSVPISVRDVARDRSVNLAGTEHVLRASIEGGVSRFVFISSGGAIYGEADGADEACLPRPASPYGVHKLAAEGYVRNSGMSFGIARYANVFGPRQRSDLEGGVVAIFCERLAAGLPVAIFGDGEQCRDFVFVTDVAEATLAIAMAGRDGVWNVATGASTSVNELLMAVSERTAPPSAVVREPARAGDVVVSRLANTRIADDLGWRPRFSLREGLALTLRVPR